MTTNATVSSVRYDVDADGICALTIDVPGASMNTFGTVLTNDLIAAIERAAADENARGILLTSGKEGFLAGADLKQVDAGGGAGQTAQLTVAEQIDRSMTLSKMCRRLETLGKPVAVVINGVAAGGGLELALAAHYRVVVDNPAIRLGLPESNVGLIPGGGGTQRLPRLIGIEKALPLMLAGSLVRPDEALKAGFIDAVVPKEKAVAEARRWLLEDADPVQPWDKKNFRIPGGLPAETASVRQLMSISVGLTRARTFGNMPAQEAILAVVWEGTQLPFDTALRLEAKYFHRVFNHPTSKALIRTMFVSKQAADKLSMRPAGVPAASIRTLGIAGAGTMGAGLALTASRAGLDVILLDVTEEKADAGKAYAAKRLDRDIEKGRSTPEKAAAILGRIRPTVDFAQFAGADYVIEAVFEDTQIKRDVYARIEEHLPAGVILASNTSALPVSKLAEDTNRAENFIGMHFFSPAERMPLVEIIRGHRTSDATLAHALDLAKVLRKTPIVVNDSRGFFTSRFIGSFMGESVRMVQEGVLVPLVENGARMLGMPQGPLTVADAIGLDVGRKAGIEAVRSNPSGDLSSYGLPEVLVGKYDRYGRKNGKGFYDYAADGSRTVWAGLADLVPTLAQQPSIEEVKARLLYAQLAEGARAFGEGVLLDVTGGDLGATLGVGFPAHLGGPFVAMDNIGIPQVVAESDRLRAAYGEQFAIPDLLREMAENGQTFYGANPVASPGAGGRIRAEAAAR